LQVHMVSSVGTGQTKLEPRDLVSMAISTYSKFDRFRYYYPFRVTE